MFFHVIRPTEGLVAYVAVEGLLLPVYVLVPRVEIPTIRAVGAHVALVPLGGTRVVLAAAAPFSPTRSLVMLLLGLVMLLGRRRLRRAQRRRQRHRAGTLRENQF